MSRLGTGLILIYACALGATGCAKKVESESSAITACTPPTLVTAPTLTDCTPAAPAAGAHTGNVLISWTANHETAVNSAGGGYRIDYSTDPSFPVGQTTTVDVPYVSGPTAPVSAPLTGLAAGNYCIRITAYSTLNPTGSPSVTTVGVP